MVCFSPEGLLSQQSLSNRWSVTDIPATGKTLQKVIIQEEILEYEKQSFNH